MILEELDRQVAVREGEIVERMPVMRAATRAMGLKAAKGDVKAYTALALKLDAIEDRRRAHQEETLKAILEYVEDATLELMRRKRERVSGPEIIPHPDDIDVDRKTGSIVFHGPRTADERWRRTSWSRLGQRVSAKCATRRSSRQRIPRFYVGMQNARGIGRRPLVWWRGVHPRSIHGR
jgi:hypothetical protein